LPNDAPTAIPYLAHLEAKGFIHRFELAFSSPAPLAYSRKQTDVFIATYKRPVANTLEKLSAKQLLSRITRFVSFKSRTTPECADRPGWTLSRWTSRRQRTLLPTSLRSASSTILPPDTLELDVTDPHVLTTYAGLLLRDLLDQFGGDVERAVGAYNGGPRNPNPQYAAGVQMVASYARNVLERVTAVNERSAKADLAASSQS